MVGVHTPEFPFEQNIDNVRQAANDMNVWYSIALDSEYEVWRRDSTAVVSDEGMSGSVSSVRGLVSSGRLHLVGDRTRWNGNEHHVGVRGIPAVAPERPDVVARLSPETCEAAPDRSLADGRDVHCREQLSFGGALPSSSMPFSCSNPGPFRREQSGRRGLCSLAT